MFKRIIFIFLMFFLTVKAHANLQVFPTHISLSDKARTAQISIRHIGPKPANYRISVVYYRMNSDGGMVLDKNPRPEDKFAENYFKYSPRKVELQPNIEQVVRIILRKPSDLPEGDYRAHLHFEQEDPPPPAKGDAKPGEFKMGLAARLAIAVPVIVHQKQPTVNAKLGELKLLTLPDKKRGFTVEISNVGNGFVFGDLRAFQIVGNEKPVLIGEVNAISSYIPKRTATYPFSEQDSFKPNLGGILRLELRKSLEEGGEVMATTDVPIATK